MAIRRPSSFDVQERAGVGGSATEAVEARCA